MIFLFIICFSNRKTPDIFSRSSARLLSGFHDLSCHFLYFTLWVYVCVCLYHAAGPPGKSPESFSFESKNKSSDLIQSAFPSICMIPVSLPYLKGPRDLTLIFLALEF